MERVNCPCCGFPTLGESAAYEICCLCHWEDDGHGELEANEVWGGPNGSYSLLQARENFKNFRTMYSPSDIEINQNQSFVLLESKEKLIDAYNRLNAASEESRQEIGKGIFKLEKFLV